MRSLASKPNVQAPNVDYPNGRIKDDTGAGDGTPVNELVYGDFHQFFEQLMNAAAVVPNDLPDNVTNGFQLFQALLKHFVSNTNNVGIKVKIIPIGVWNMQISAGGTNISRNHGVVDFEKIVSVQVIVRNDGGNIRKPIENWSALYNDIGGYSEIDNNTINVGVKPGGMFDKPEYSSVAIDRGTIFISYYD